jgi:hypothetical protein
MFDMSGRTIATIVSGERSEGSHIMPITFSGMSSGNYLLVLETKSGKVAKNVVIAK